MATLDDETPREMILCLLSSKVAKVIRGIEEVWIRRAHFVLFRFRLIEGSSEKLMTITKSKKTFKKQCNDA
jgi:hypothetical protein